jgi:TM2 domain-containing membrane protein YozV
MMDKNESHFWTGLVGAFVLGWLIPGLGHMFLGRRGKGLFIFLVLTSTFLAGMLLADFRGVTFDDNLFYFLGRYGSGLTLGLNLIVVSSVPRGLITPRLYEVGTLYMSLAGLLNVFVLFNLPLRRGGTRPAENEMSVTS